MTKPIIRRCETFGNLVNVKKMYKQRCNYEFSTSYQFSNLVVRTMCTSHALVHKEAKQNGSVPRQLPGFLAQYLYRVHLKPRSTYAGV